MTTEPVPGAGPSRPGGFTTAIVKLTAVCNLNCSYCYMFNLADKSYSRTYRFMPARTAAATVDAIAAYCAERDLRSFSIALHGGEPSMWPLDRFEHLLDRVEHWRARGLELRLVAQTNGLHLPDPLLDLWHRHGVEVGVSLDGPPWLHDTYRTRHDGRGSYATIMRNVERMLAGGHRSLLNGFLCVAQPAIDPTEFLDWAEELPAGIDVLWPIEFHHGNPPWGAGPIEEYARAPRYGTWFSALFLEWAARGSPVRVRLFEQTVGAVLGARPAMDALANEHLPALVVNTGGQIELNDYVRSYEDGAAETGLHVSQGLGAAEAHPAFRHYLDLREHRPAECTGCPVVEVCGGGFLPGRMAPGADRPVGRSVLCYDQFAFFTTVQSVVRDARERALAGSG
ncbi:MAG TPA: radical SAM protein [Nocardioides sp.]|nr:radical SAM protein [Nocardioides sp.]